jgi:hypothetical protein
MAEGLMKDIVKMSSAVEIFDLVFNSLGAVKKDHIATCHRTEPKPITNLT